MTRVHTTAFNETDCIGDCYEPINNSLDNLDTAVQDLSSYDNTLKTAITPSGNNLTITNNLTAKNIYVTTQVLNSASNPILRQTGSVLETYYYEYTDQFSTTVIRTYQTYKSQTITALGKNSRFRVEASVFGLQQLVQLHRYNLGFEVVTPSGTVRIYGTDGPSGNSWQGNYYYGNVYRNAIWTSSVAAGASLTFRLLLASYDAASSTWNPTGYNSIANFIITEIAS